MKVQHVPPERPDIAITLTQEEARVLRHWLHAAKNTLNVDKLIGYIIADLDKHIQD
jgi:hypothetical protein